MVRPTVISTFAGCGGSSLGYKMAGFKELLAIDFDKNSVETFHLNFPEVTCWEMDIKEVTAEDILSHCNIKKGELDVLDGSPPCQGFSTVGKRNVSDSRNDLFKEYIRLITELAPKVFVMENVTGMIKGTMKGRFIEIMETLKALDYNVKCKQLNAANYGVPQTRQRVFFIGVRKDLNKEPVYPVPQKNVVSFNDAVKDQQISIDSECYKFSQSERFQKVIERIKPGQRGQDIDIKGLFSVIRIKGNKPLNTVTKTKHSGCGLLHHEELRWLSIDEIKLGCSFPSDFQLIGKYEDKWARLGNAVMPLQMKAIAQTIKKEILT